MDSNDEIKDLTKKILHLEREVKNLGNTRNELFGYLAVMMLFFGLFTWIFPGFTFIIFFITALVLFIMGTDIFS